MKRTVVFIGMWLCVMLMFSSLQVYSQNDWYFNGNLPFLRPNVAVVYSGFTMTGNRSMIVDVAYLVKGTDDKGVDMRVINYTRPPDGDGMIAQDYEQASPWSEGPFWIDPMRLHKLKQGDRLVYGQNEYIVLYVGSVDGIRQFDQFASVCPLYSEQLQPTVVFIATAKQHEEGRDYHSAVFDRDTGLLLYQSSKSTINNTSVSTYMMMSAINYNFQRGVVSWEKVLPYAAGGGARGVGSDASMQMVYANIYLSSGCSYAGKVYGTVGFIYTLPGQYPMSLTYEFKGEPPKHLQLTVKDTNDPSVEKGQTMEVEGWPLVWIDPQYMDDRVVIEGEEYTKEASAENVVYRSTTDDSVFVAVQYDKKTGVIIGGTVNLGGIYLELNYRDDAWRSMLSSVYRELPDETVIILQIGDKKIRVNGNIQFMDTSPRIIPQWKRTVVPVRFVAEALGANVGWDGKERKVTIKRGANTIEMWIGKPQALVNGKKVWIDSGNHNVTPIIIDDRTMVPLRFVSESLGLKVGWNALFRQIYLVGR